MDIKDFMTRIQGYYGNYSNGQGPEVVKYLVPFTERYEDYLEKLFTYTLKSFSSRWKMPPDIAIFEDAKDFVKGDMPTRKALPLQTNMIEEDYLSPEDVGAGWKKVKEAMRGGK
ncbi:MAG: hypothetical protein ISR78_04690 [Spirochaetia bacterium]|nr:hypothetical protein [Spirochaetia bacterium]